MPTTSNPNPPSGFNGAFTAIPPSEYGPTSIRTTVTAPKAAATANKACLIQCKLFIVARKP